MLDLIPVEELGLTVFDTPPPFIKDVLMRLRRFKAVNVGASENTTALGPKNTKYGMLISNIPFLRQNASFQNNICINIIQNIESSYA